MLPCPLLKLNGGTPQEVRFVYDSGGNRVSKPVGTGATAVTTKFLVDSNNLLSYAQVIEGLIIGKLILRPGQHNGCALVLWRDKAPDRRPRRAHLRSRLEMESRWQRPG
jgi:hypothetical protein